MSSIPPLGNERTLKIGIVGCGRILPAHLRGYQVLRRAGIDNFRITALCARRLDDARMFRQRGEGPAPRPAVSSDAGDPLSAPHLYVSDLHDASGVKIFDDWREMLERADIDAIDVTASVAIHHDVAVAAAQCGKHVMMQKPLAVSVAAGRRMVEAAVKAGRVLAVMENVRYSPYSRLVRWLIERGELGSLQMAALIAYGSTRWGPDRIVADTPWRHRKVEAGGGASIDIGVHWAHQIRYACAEVKAVTARTRVFEPVRVSRDTSGGVLQTVAADADDAFFAFYDLEGGGVAQTTFTWAGHGRPISLGPLVVYGSRGSLRGEEVMLDGQSPFNLRERFTQAASAADHQRVFPLGVGPEGADAFALAYRDFFAAIREGRPAEMSGEEGLRDLAVAFGMLESSHAGRTIAVDDVLSGRVRAYQADIDRHYGLADA